MRKRQISSPSHFAQLVHERDHLRRYYADDSVIRLIFEDHPELAWHLAELESLPEWAISRLAVCESAYARGRIASRADLPMDALDSLLDDIRVRDCLVNHPGLRQEQVVSLRDVVTFEFSGRETQSAFRSRLKRQFAVHARDLAVTPETRHLSPYMDAAGMSAHLRGLGFGHLDPESPKPSADWAAACEASDDVCGWIAHAGFTAPDVFAFLAGTSGWEAPEAVAMSPDCPPSVLAALAFDWDAVVRSEVARNRSTDLPTLLYLAFDESIAMENPNGVARSALDFRFGIRLTPSDASGLAYPSNLSAIRTDVDFEHSCRSAVLSERIRAKYARLSQSAFEATITNANLRTDLLWNQTSTIEQRERIEAIESPDSSASDIWGFVELRRRPEFAEYIAAHPDPEVREWLVRSRFAPRMLVERMAKLNTPMLDLANPEDDLADTARWVLYWNFGHRNRPGRRVSHSPRIRSADEFARLIADGTLGASEHATMSKAAFPSLWSEVLRTRPDLAKWVAINETVSPRLLDELADWPDPEVRGWVAEHPRVWLKTLVRLGSDRDNDVRRYAVYNARMPDSQLRKMTSDPVERTRTEAAFRLAAREYARRLLVDPNWWQHLGNSEI